MAIEKLTIKAFLQFSKQHPILDVRSPGEFQHAHIPGAYNLPLFSDDERRIVGTAYKQQNRESAIKTGLEFFGIKMRKMIEEVESLQTKTVLVHCWRGGMRSAGISWLLDLYGYRVYNLIGGYKSFRRYVLDIFNCSFAFKILGGFTGSGKTDTLIALEKKGESIIDLENLASHKGSAFGKIDNIAQPSQEMFENKLAMQLSGKMNGSIWVEDESQRIGSINIPPQVWKNMQQSPVFFLDIPFEERLKRILVEYGNADIEYLTHAISRIQKRLGGYEAKTATHLILENDLRGGFSVLLKYYDKCYQKSIFVREKNASALCRLPCANVDIEGNSSTLLNSQISHQAIF